MQPAPETPAHQAGSVEIYKCAECGLITHTSHQNETTKPVEPMVLEDMRTGRETEIFRERILSMLDKNGLNEPPLVRMLDYIIDLFESNGLGKAYYGYHNIHHELAVTYVMLVSACSEHRPRGITDMEIKHLYMAALLHDFDPRKSVDKPHEEMVLGSVSGDPEIKDMLQEAGIDIHLVKALILSTTYPWSGENRNKALLSINDYFAQSRITRTDANMQKQYHRLGRCLSIVDRISGYALGNFEHSMELAKMNAHALAWKPSLIVRRSVAYFEGVMNEEPDVFHSVMGSLPTEMRNNFFNAVLSFMNLRSTEISVHADFKYRNQQFSISMDGKDIRQDPEFASSLRSIYDELPTPLKFLTDKFEETIADPEIILNTLRLSNGRIIGFAKGGPLEYYNLKPQIHDKNLGLFNTIFLEPLALRRGYWALGGGSMMRNHFVMQADSKRFKYLTGFALREVIESRLGREPIEFVKKVDPERWDYYRLRL